MAAKITIALLLCLLYAWVIMGTMPYRREVIQQQDLNDYYSNLDRELEFAKNEYEAIKARDNAPPQMLYQAQERLALYHWEKKQYDKAVVLFADLLSKRRPKEGDTSYNEDYAVVLLRLGSVFRDVNNFTAAQSTYQELFDYDKKFFEQSDPNNAKISRDYNNMGLLYYLMGTSETDVEKRNALLKKGSESLNEAIKRYRAKLGPDSPSEAISLWNLYLTERDQGHVKEANEIKTHAEAIDTKMNRPCKAP